MCVCLCLYINKFHDGTATKLILLFCWVGLELRGGKSRRIELIESTALLPLVERIFGVRR